MKTKSVSHFTFIKNLQLTLWTITFYSIFSFGVQADELSEGSKKNDAVQLSKAQEIASEETRIQSQSSEIPCLSFEECKRNPVRIESLGANWQYKRDADKLPIIRNALASRKLKSRRLVKIKEPAFCTAFKEDFLAGRHIQVIEPEYQVLALDDSRLTK